VGVSGEEVVVGAWGREGGGRRGKEEGRKMLLLMRLRWGQDQFVGGGVGRWREGRGVKLSVHRRRGGACGCEVVVGVTHASEVEVNKSLLS